jgi:hypothetical protein
LLLLTAVFIAASCIGTRKDIQDALDRNVIDDDYTILHVADVKDGHLVFLERNAFNDIMVALVHKSGDKSKTDYGGYLRQDPETQGTLYFAGTLGGNTYSVYFGNLIEPPAPNEKIHIELGNHIKKEAALFQASRAAIWFVCFDEKTEHIPVSVLRNVVDA